MSLKQGILEIIKHFFNKIDILEVGFACYFNKPTT